MISFTREDFLRDHKRQRLQTIRLVKVFRDEDLGLRPGEGSMSVAEQVNHLCAAGNFTRGLFAEERPGLELFQRQYDTNSVAACVASLAAQMRETLEAAAAASDERLAEIVEPFGPEWRMPRLALALLMADHESHHRGQLYVYARVAGRPAPLVYAPVDESILED